MELNDIVATSASQFTSYPQGLVDAMPRLIAAIVVVVLTWIVAAHAKSLVRSLKLRRNLVNVLAILAGTGVWTIGLVMAVTILFPTITPGKALTTLGLGAVAIGFAFKDRFENFLAGILILLREPFAINDYIECEDIEGQVEEITIRDSHIRKRDGQLVFVPNRMLFENPVVVRTDRDLRRTTIRGGVGYGEDADGARRMIFDAVEGVDSVRKDVKDVQIIANSFGASSIDFEVTWWTEYSPLDIRTSRDQVVAAVKAALDNAGIETPFPYRTMTVNIPVPVTSDTSEKPSEDA